MAMRLPVDEVIPYCELCGAWAEFTAVPFGRNPAVYRRPIWPALRSVGAVLQMESHRAGTPCRFPWLVKRNGRCQHRRRRICQEPIAGTCGEGRMGPTFCPGDSRAIRSSMNSLCAPLNRPENWQTAAQRGVRVCTRDRYGAPTSRRRTASFSERAGRNPQVGPHRAWSAPCCDRVDH